MQRTHTVIQTAAVIALALVIGVITWQGLWWLRENGTNREAGINRQTAGAQTAYSDKVSALIADIAALGPDSAPLRIALTTEACQIADRLTPAYTTARIATFAAQEC